MPRAREVVIPVTADTGKLLRQLTILRGCAEQIREALDNAIVALQGEDDG